MGQKRLLSFDRGSSCWLLATELMQNLVATDGLGVLGPSCGRAGMPVDRRRWQPCLFGALSESAQHAIPGCHASRHFKRDRSYNTRGRQLKLARKLVDSFVAAGG